MLDNFRSKGKEVGYEVRERIVGYLTAAFGLVAALAWNDAVKGLIEYLFPQKSGGVFLKFGYALALTLVLVAVTIVLLRFNKKNKP